jgi:small subunit ribosomal protein S4
VCKLCRREGSKLFLKGERCYGTKCAVEPNRRPFPPGPRQQRRRKTSEYGSQLREKQKVRRVYGVLERQFRKMYVEAGRRTGASGENLLQILESRLDNVVFRAGLADSRAQARQLVLHGHICVNGQKTDIPSRLLVASDVLTVSPTSRSLTYFTGMSEELQRKSVPSWISLDPAALSGRVLRLPERTEIDSTINEQLIVEHYSR